MFARWKTIQYLSFEEKTLTTLGIVHPETREEESKKISGDVVLNYVGAEDRESMLAERPRIEQAVQAVFAREGFTVRRMPEEHGGEKWSLRYQGAAGQGGNLEVELNFMFRVPL